MKLKAPENFGGAVVGGVEINPSQVGEDGSIEIEDGAVVNELLSHHFTVFVEEDEDEQAEAAKAGVKLTKAQAKKLAAETAAAKAEEDRIAAEQAEADKAAAEKAASEQGN